MRAGLRAAFVFTLLLGVGLPVQPQASTSCSGGGEEELTCWFNQGLNLQERSELAEAPEEKKSLLAEAAAAYERALAIDHTRGAVLNNLAGVYADLGEDSKAESLFERAVAQEEEQRQPFYRRNFGDFLAHRGHWERAAEQYRKALEEAPEDIHAHEGLTAILKQHRPEALPEYLRFLISRGQVLWVEEVALARLQEKATEEYLSLLVESLAGQFPSPDELLPERTAQLLRNLAGQPELGEGAREILRLSEGKDFHPTSYGWWAERGKGQGGSGPSPRQVFRGLIRSFGDAQYRAERPSQARDYFQLAVTLTPEEPDLLSFRRLIELPPTALDIGTIDRLAASNEEKLRKKDVDTPAELYLYRHDVGLFYAFEQRWGGDRGQPLGIYQLQRSVALANTPVVGLPGGEPPFDARVYSRLMDGYLDTHQPAEAERTWQELADAYRQRGMDAEADILLAVFRSRPRRPLERQRDVLDDPPGILQDFTTNPPEPPND